MNACRPKNERHEGPPSPEKRSPAAVRVTAGADLGDNKRVATYVGNGNTFQLIEANVNAVPP